jgi:hypothetical protein
VLIRCFKTAVLLNNNYTIIPCVPQYLFGLRLGPALCRALAGGSVVPVVLLSRVAADRPLAGRAIDRASALGRWSPDRCVPIARVGGWSDSVAVGFSFRAALAAESGSVNPVRN